MHNGSWVSFCMGQWVTGVIHCLLCHTVSLDRPFCVYVCVYFCDHLLIVLMYLSVCVCVCIHVVL